LRQEYKYLVPKDDLEDLKARVMPYLIGDDHIHIGTSNEYTVRSIYFDTTHLDKYHKKLAGLLARKKIRIRGYNEYQPGSIVFLEIKRKNNMSISKNRAPVAFEDLSKLLFGGDISTFIKERNDFPLALENANRFLFHYYRYNLKPVVLVMYEREAYINKFDHTDRVTFDKNLRSIAYPSIKDLYSNENIKYTYTDHFILEVKSNKGFPKWMKPVIGHFGLKREAISKYTESIDTQTSPRMTYTKGNVIAFSSRPLSKFSANQAL
jgi:SPX domain protein involved in polyphosphate accumulation